MIESKKVHFDAKGTAGLLGSIICWSLGPLFLKTLAGHMDAWTQNALRYIVSCIIWVPYLVYAHKRGKLPRSVWRKAWPVVVANLFMQTCWAAGFYFVSATFHNLMAKSTVIWVPLAAVIFFPGERRLFRSKLLWTGMLLSLTGVAGVIIAGEGFEMKATIMGALIINLATIGWAAYTVTIRKCLNDVDARVAFGVVSVYSVVGFLALMFIFGDPSQCLTIPASIWTAVVLSAVLAIALSHSLYYMTINRIGATIPALALLTTPFVVALLANIFLNESLTGAQWLWGIVLIAGGVFSVTAQRDLKGE